MVRGELIIADYGRAFTGWAGVGPEKIVCVAPPEIENDAKIRDVIREMVRRQGGDCASCRACLIGRTE